MAATLAARPESRGTPLPNANRAVIPRGKLVDYAMAPEHPANRDKWKAYESLGYDVHNAREQAADDVARQVNAQLSEAPAERIDDTEWGERHNVRFLIVGPNGRRGTLVTGWQTDAGSDRPRLVTLWLKPHREDT